MTDTTADIDRAGSIRGRIAALDVGQTAAEAERITLADADAESVAKTVERLRNRMNPAVARAKAATGGDYAIETGDFMTRGRDLVVVYTVTRLD